MTTLQEVKARMAEMIEKKNAELAEIRAKTEETAAEIAEAEERIKAATAEMNLAAYEKAVEAKQKASVALDMYNAKFDQLQKAEYISEAESDAVIDSLLDYEKTLEVDFKIDLEQMLRPVKQILADYMAEVKDTENTIARWQREIHANYKTRGRTFYNVNGKHTDRSPKPVPVTERGICEEAHKLKGYLDA